MENQLLERLKGLPFHYEMHCYEKETVVDDYEQGEIDDVQCWEINHLEAEGATLRECIEKACDELCVDFTDDCYQVINDRDILICCMEDEDGCKAYPCDIERWKKGEQRLWSVTYRREVKICFDQLGEEFLEEELKTA